MKHPHLTLGLALTTALFSTACKKEPVDDTGEPIPVETGETGQPAEGYVDGLRVQSELIGVPNLDDDDGDKKSDFDFSALPDPDHAPLLIELDAKLSMQRTALRVSLDEASVVHVWLGDTLLLDEDNLSADLPWVGDNVTLTVEFGGYFIEQPLTLTPIDAQGTALAPQQVLLSSSPLVLTHHLQPATHAWALSVAAPGYSNQALINGYIAELGADFTAVDGGTYGQDVWMQDELEFANTWAPNGTRVEVVIDSIRDRGLDRFPERELRGPETAVGVWGSGMATSQDSFGNLETTPPLTVDGVYYPFGRTYFGDGGGPLHPTRTLTNFLKNQLVQAPLSIDISWLCVGHVDEFISFVPDSTSAKGFRLAYADTRRAWELLAELDPDQPLPRYKGAAGHNLPNVGAIMDDEAIHAYNERVQVDYLDPILEQLKLEFGLTDEDIVFVPDLFEPGGLGCGQSGAALIPGMTNLVVVNRTGQETLVFTADPFVREDLDDQSTDPFIAEMRRIMPEELRVVFLDNWQVYHKALGEVHCGTNVRRPPIGEWWNEGADLMGRN